MSRPATYRENASCATCRHVFRIGRFDDGDSLFCGLRGGERPPCGSLAMDESFYLDRRGHIFRDDEKTDAMRAAWDLWSAGREVAPHGVCDEQEERQ